MKTETSSTWLPLAGVMALWAPAMIAASYEWTHGAYYDYGWVVPPVAAWLLFRRWKDQRGPVGITNSLATLLVFLLLVPWFTGLRILGEADPLWRLPIAVSGLTAAAMSHVLIAKTRGVAASREFLWITLSLMIPWDCWHFW
jgi:hypothetical protein